MEEKTYSFPKTHRLRSKADFSGVFGAKVSEMRGPLVMYARPNELGHPRLGLVVGRAVGTAVRRNRIKRLVREAFRMHQHDLPRGYDLVVVVRPHAPMILAEYQKLMTGLMVKLNGRWVKRESQGGTGGQGVLP